MGRTAKAIDVDQMLDLLSSGLSNKEVAETMGVSAPTIANRVEELKRKESALLAYEKTQHLDLLCVQKRLIDGITDEKIEEAPLSAIAQAFGVFKKAEHLSTGRPTEVIGLMGYLLKIEEEERGVVDITPAEENND